MAIRTEVLWRRYLAIALALGENSGMSVSRLADMARALGGRLELRLDRRAARATGDGRGRAPSILAMLAFVLFAATIATPWVWAYGCAPTPSPSAATIEQQAAESHVGDPAGCVIREPRSSDIALLVLVVDALLPTPPDLPLDLERAGFIVSAPTPGLQRVDPPLERPPTFLAA